MQKRPWAEICLVILGTLLYFMANLQRVAVPGSMFDILTHDLHTTAQTVSSLGSVFMYSYAFGQLIIGVLLARYGGFRVVRIGALLFFIGSIIFPFSNNFTILFLCRCLLGLGAASFYLGMINEVRRLVHKKNFGIILSAILFIGYLGGIVANAPLVLYIEKSGWKEIFIIVGLLTTLLAFLFIIFDRTADHIAIDKTIHFDLKLYKEVFSNKKNLFLFLFACFNYGLYYVIQTVIGKKFLEDFCLLPSITAATILSVMGFMYAIAGSVFALISKLAYNRRTIFLKLSGLNTLIVFGIILGCVCIDFKTNYIALGFLTISFGAGLSPLLVPLLHDYNGDKTANTAISIMTCGFFLVVAILGNIIGFCLDLFSHLRIEGSYTAHNFAYISIFSVMFLLSVISFIFVFKIEESKKTIRLIEHMHYIKEHELIKHDDYELKMYNNL